MAKKMKKVEMHEPMHEHMHEMEMGGCCGGGACETEHGHGHSFCNWSKLFYGLVVVVLGLMLVWPRGWFTFEHTLGVLVVLFGLKKVWHSCHHSEGCC